MAITRTTTTTMMTMMSPSRHSLCYTNPCSLQNFHTYKHVTLCHNAINISIKTLSSSSKRLLVKAASKDDNGGSSVEASIAEAKDTVIAVRNATFVMESRDDDKVKVRVDLTGEDTKFAFEKVLRNLAKTAPPVPGFRKQKGGKTSRVPTEILLRMLGETAVTNFVIREIVTATLGDYAKSENLSVKDNKVTTIQTAEELKEVFSPGDVFGFNAVIELEDVESTSDVVDEASGLESVENTSDVVDEVAGLESVEDTSVIVDDVAG